MVVISNLSFKSSGVSAENSVYKDYYRQQVSELTNAEKDLAKLINSTDLGKKTGIRLIKEKIAAVRMKLKASDIWLRYLDPVAYRRINGPLPVEWETEVFEKFETPYRREGSGLTLAELYLEENKIQKDSLLILVNSGIAASDVFSADSTTKNLDRYHHFFLANRLFLLNLAALYTTGFECPDPENIVPELNSMLTAVKQVYNAYDKSFPAYAVDKNYLDMYEQMIAFVKSQPTDINSFDHFIFIRDHVNPLFGANQEMIRKYRVISNSFVDYTLEEKATSIFDKALYNGQNAKGIFLRVDDPAALNEIKKIGKLLFYDPILSGNNKRSCVSCHKSGEYFTDTSKATSFQFDNQQSLPRNTPSLINSVYNHLIMLDGKHTSLLNQAKDVVTNATEMGGVETDVVKNVMSCKEYEKAFKKFTKYTPAYKDVKIDHIVSAVILYYSDFSKYYSPFDHAMNDKKPLDEESKKGFNIFMSKAQCGTCHFVPQFNGVKPPYVGSEFEVLGVPTDNKYTMLSPDSGRAMINPAKEMLHAFRTGTIRNSQFTMPYMHNGAFKTLEEVIDFYDAGGGSGKGLKVSNQTLSSDSLKLDPAEKKQLVSFMHSLTEQVHFEEPPAKLPSSKDKRLNNRKVGGEF